VVPAGLLGAGGAGSGWDLAGIQGRVLVTEAVDKAGDASDSVGADGIHLLLDCDGVLRDVGRELRDLRPDRAAEAQDDAEGHDDGQQNGWHPTEPRSAQQLDNRHKQEGEQDRQRDRDQDFTREIERGDHHHADLQGAGRAWRCGRRDRGGQPRRRRGIRRDQY
jgi:hypothetical protein